MIQQISKGRGGARPGAGRPRGSANKKTREIADKAAEGGITPLEVMLEAMRAYSNEAANAEGEARLKLLAAASGIAKDAAPYIHPRLQAIEHTAGKSSGDSFDSIVANLHAQGLLPA